MRYLNGRCFASFVPVRRNDRVSVGASRNAQSSSPQYHAAEIQIGDSEPRKFWFRSGTTDQVVMNEIFGATQYGLGRLRRAREIKSFQERQIATNKVPLIIDAGANIGATSANCGIARLAVDQERKLTKISSMHFSA